MIFVMIETLFFFCGRRHYYSIILQERVELTLLSCTDDQQYLGTDHDHSMNDVHKGGWVHVNSIVMALHAHIPIIYVIIISLVSAYPRFYSQTDL